MTIIELNKRLYTVPTQWNELTGKQLVKVLRLMSTEVYPQEGYMRLLKILTGIGWYRFLKVNPVDYMNYFYLTDFLLRDNNLTKNLLPQYKGFAGPADDFQNLLMDEFAYTEDYFLRWTADESSEKLLNELVAILYRKRKPHYDKKRNVDGDARLPFNEYLCNYHAANDVAHWRLDVKRAIAFWYAGCRGKMMADFAQLFGGAGGDPAKYGLLSIMRNVAEKGVHGSFKDVEQLPVRLVMVELDEMMGEAERIKKMN